MDRLWAATPDYSWESLRQGLESIRSREVVSYEEYQDLLYAINKLENLGEGFPESSSELYNLMSYYM